MKKNNSIKTVSLVLAGLIAAAGCSGKSGTTDAPAGNNGGSGNSQPQIVGVSDTSVEAGSQFNAFAGISASDAEDGDLTSKIKIEAMPSLDFINGVATPDKACSYELTYTVADKDGATSEAYATLTVTRQTSEATTFREFKFDGAKAADSKGWEANIADGADAKGELKEGAFVFDIVSPGNSDGDIRLVKTGMKLKAADYKIKVWARSTAKTYAHFIAKDENSEEWKTFGAEFNLPITEEMSALELNFTSDGDNSAEIMLNLGKITPNPDAPGDTTPGNFSVTIDKIEIYEISGEETNNAVYINDLSDPDEGAVTVSAGDGADANVSFADGAAKVAVDAYPTDGGVWSIKTDIALPGISLEAGRKYYYSFKVTGAAAQSGECLVESASQYDKLRADFAGLSTAAGEETVIAGKFTSDKNIDDPVIRLQIGNPSEGVTSNVLAIDDIEFGTVDGDLETVKTIDSFAQLGRGTANETDADLPWMTFNGSDEENEGVGTIWTDGKSLFYRIDKGGTVDWHNKLICGYGENPLTLPCDSYYTVEITAKADKNVSCGFFLNPVGGWDPRIAEGMDITTVEQTFTFETKDTFITDMDFEMLFQFGSEATAGLGDVTIEFTSIKILQRTIS